MTFLFWFIASLFNSPNQKRPIMPVRYNRCSICQERTDTIAVTRMTRADIFLKQAIRLQLNQKKMRNPDFYSLWSEQRQCLLIRIGESNQAEVIGPP